MIELQKLIYLQFCRSRSIKDGFWNQRKDNGMTTCNLQNDYVGMMMDINVNAIHNEGLPTVWHLFDSQNLGVKYIKNPHKTYHWRYSSGKGFRY